MQILVENESDVWELEVRKEQTRANEDERICITTDKQRNSLITMHIIN
jgi:hypothetical protein